MRKIVWLLFLSMLLLFSVSLPAWANGTTVGPVVAPPTIPDQINVGDEFTVDVKVNNVAGLKGVSLELLYCPSLLEVIDADPDEDGIQISPGNLFEGKIDRLIADNKVENNSIFYSVLVTKPASAFTGDEVNVSRINFKAIAPGTCLIKFNPASNIGEGGIVLSAEGGALIPSTPFSATVKVLGPQLEKTIEVNLTNGQAVNTQRPLGIEASAYENSTLVPVGWVVNIKEGANIKATLNGNGTTFQGSWTPSAADIPADLPMASKNYQVEVKATYADNGTVPKTDDFTLSNYDLVIKKVEYVSGKINVTVKNLAQAQKTADCILQISKADGTLVKLIINPSADIAPGENIIELSPDALSAGNYKAEVFLWDLATWQTLSSPKEINFTV